MKDEPTAPAWSELLADVAPLPGGLESLRRALHEPQSGWKARTALRWALPTTALILTAVLLFMLRTPSQPTYEHARLLLAPPGLAAHAAASRLGLAKPTPPTTAEIRWLAPAPNQPTIEFAAIVATKQLPLVPVR